MKDKIIVAIDDEADILEILKYNFMKERAHVKTFKSGEQGLHYIIENKPDAVICDWMLPDIDGIEICKKLKGNRGLEDIPFIMLTAKSDEIDAVLALEMGADDYVMKPVRIKELISRVKREIKKRKHKKSNDIKAVPSADDSNKTALAERQNESLFFKDFVINTEKYKAYIHEKELDLTHSEFKLLHLFINKPGKVFTRNQIIEKLSGMDYIVTERSIDVQIVGLRKKMGKHKDHLETVRGVGYRLRE
ncbi:MAG: response regulator transcription factor [Bacteroidota bacterium]|nr:response regulator transcription factor [uncultured Allomuricauda sp.]